MSYGKETDESDVVGDGFSDFILRSPEVPLREVDIRKFHFQKQLKERSKTSEQHKKVNSMHKFTFRYLP